jgi:predicted thioesterase
MGLKQKQLGDLDRYLLAWVSVRCATLALMNLAFEGILLGREKVASHAIPVNRGSQLMMAIVLSQIDRKRVERAAEVCPIKHSSHSSSLSATPTRARTDLSRE